MTLREEAEHALEAVPDFKLSELIHYMRFLSECPVTLGKPEGKRGRPRDLWGALEGKIWVADDFDESMELVPKSEIMELREAAGVHEAELKEGQLMILRDEDLKILKNVPVGKWHEVMDFARYLIDSAEKEKSPEIKNTKPYRSGGWVKGEIWLSDDFNDPLEFVSDSEIRALNAMREGKIQEAAV